MKTCGDSDHSVPYSYCPKCKARLLVRPSENNRPVLSYGTALGVAPSKRQAGLIVSLDSVLDDRPDFPRAYPLMLKKLRGQRFDYIPVKFYNFPALYLKPSNIGASLFCINVMNERAKLVLVSVRANFISADVKGQVGGLLVIRGRPSMVVQGAYPICSR